jgi:predicted acylesterase/phospholipase RssA
MTKQYDPPGLSEEEMLKLELAEVGKPDERKAARELLERLEGTRTDQPYTIGLALSGGGIRSATVSLGVLQKLAQAKLLKHVDYLSTVSGGGYIGSALDWWLRCGETQESMYDTGERFPYGTDDPSTPERPRPPKPSPERPLTPLQYLRSQGNYLIPGNGITLWSGVSMVLRGIFLNLLVWIPITALVVLLLLLFGYCPLINGLPYLMGMTAPGALEAASGLVGSAGTVDVRDTIPPAFLLLLLIAGALFLLFLFGSLNYSLLTWTAQADRREKSTAAGLVPERKWYSWILVGLIALIGLVILGATAFWLMKVGGLLFANLDAFLEVPPKYRTVEGWRWELGLLVVAAILTVICLAKIGYSLTGSNQRRLLAAVVGLAVIAVLRILIDRYFVPFERTNGWERVTAFWQLAFGLGFLAFANYLVGQFIRHLLRHQTIGGSGIEEAVPSTSLLQYHARRVFEWFYGGALFWSLALATVGVLPLVVSYIRFELGGLWAAIGLAMTAAGNLRARAAGHGGFTNFLIAAGAALFAYGILVVGYQMALAFDEGGTGTRTLIGAAIFVAALTGWFVNTNQTGLHRFYRDRLMEAFMPDDKALRDDVNRMACEANEFSLPEAWAGDRAKGPYHIVNTNLVLSNSDARKFRTRAGDNFILSPFLVGSSATGWLRTEGSEFDDMSLASAMAISAAAANPRGAAGGKGVTRNSSVAIVMSLLNVRLGYWVRNPNPRAVKNDPAPPRLHTAVPSRSRRPNHFWPGGFYALSGRGYREHSKWLELADGGHFENLAVYELIRRRCGLIVVVDGGQDNASSYSDLVTAVQRASEDFGAEVRFDMKVWDRPRWDWRDSGPAQLIAKSDNTDYPKGAEFAEKGYFVASIDYGARGGGGWPRRGVIIYLKSTLIPALKIRAKGYRGAHADFPQQTTGDQFFDEEQFEAYREVGYRICAQMIEDLDLTTLFTEEGPPPYAALLANAKFKVS